MEFSAKFDAKAMEAQVRAYHETANVAALVQSELANRDRVGFIEGPPTMNGEPHAGHLRGRIIKDLWYRFRILQKVNPVFRAGWDTQGLPVELAAEKELGLTGSKAENLKKVSEEKIVETCKRLIASNNEKWIAMDNLLGMSFDYQKAYWTFRDDYIEREWQYLKKAWDAGVLKEWYRVVAYCPSCQTSLSNAEVNQGYEMVEDPSLYYKVALKDEPNTFLIVWTTMPFTVVTDEMVGVNPEAEYAYVLVGGERWLVGSDRLQELMKELRIEDFTVERKIRGSDMDGKRYVHPLLSMIPGLAELAERGSVHFVVAEPFVDTATGSGLVHLSPANGEEDFDVAEKRGVPIFVPIDDSVTFTDKAGDFAGMFVRDADARVTEAMSKAGATVKAGRIKHQYPTCWRSKHKVVWLARREYFYIIKNLGGLPIQAAEDVEYFYDQPKNRFIEIIREQHPWCISRERIWGTPLPIWSCANCGHKDPLFSRAEIIGKALEMPDGPNFELHRPWIDRIGIKCDKCGSRMTREPFVLDTWHNSGAAPYASLTDAEYRDLIPAEFLTEGIDQTRGWAYTLLMENVIRTSAPSAPFRSFLFQGHVLDEKGNKMSKSVGNVIEARQLLSENSVDLIRFYFMWKSSPIESLNFSLSEMKTRSYQVLSTLHNLHVYFRQNSSFDGFDPNAHTLEWAASKGLGMTETWLLSKMQKLVDNVTTSLSQCRYHEAARSLDEFIINAISQVYVPLTRNIVWDDSAENLDRRLAVYAVLGSALKNMDIMLHPFSPFISEYLYLTCFGGKKSIMLEAWPTEAKELGRPEVEETFDLITKTVSLANAARNLAGLKRRWPIDEVIICGTNLQLLEKKDAADILETQLNSEKARLVQINADSQADKVASLVENKMPVSVSASLVRKNVAPKVKADIGKVGESFEKADISSLLAALKASGSYRLEYGEGKSVELTASDVEFSYRASGGFVFSEREGMVVFVSTNRNSQLTAKGLMRDLVRQMQQYRKEKGYNPTHVLATGRVGGLAEEEVGPLTLLKDEMRFLVRVKDIVLSVESIGNGAGKEIEIDGRKFLISVQ